MLQMKVLVINFWIVSILALFTLTDMNILCKSELNNRVLNEIIKKKKILEYNTCFEKISKDYLYGGAFICY